MSKVFNVNESRELTFRLNVAGADPRDLTGRFNIDTKIDEMGIYFPAKIKNGFIVVDVPALDEILKKGLKEGDTYKANLEIIAEGELKIPWSGEITIKRPIDITASIEDDIKDIKDGLTIEVGDIVINENKPEKKVEKKKRPKMVFKNKKLASRLL